MARANQGKVKTLVSPTIGTDGPGSILHDFEALLAFVGDGLPSPGKHHLLPIDRLRELDERMRNPLRPALARPQQRSFPHLSGLYLLLRATGLGVAKGEGKDGRLELNPLMFDQWGRLNPTERYFNLLEAWLRHGSPEMLGERGGAPNEGYREAFQVWRSVPKEGIVLPTGPRRYSHFLYGSFAFCTLALLELFGLIEVERGELQEGENWPIRKVGPTAFGTFLGGEIFSQRSLPILLDEQPDFGAWQKQLQKSFPEWRNNLAFPEPEYRDGVYYFKVKLGSPWRRIAMPADHDLDCLAQLIIHAFRFDGDHLYNFTFRERNGRLATIEHPYIKDASAWTDDYPIGNLPLEEGQSMEFLYDFGSSWQFNVKLEKVEPVGSRKVKARIIESHGKAPEEYPSYD